MDFLKAAIANSKQKLSKPLTTTAAASTPAAAATPAATATDTPASAGLKRKADEEAAPASTAPSDEPAGKRFKSRGELEAERVAKLAREKEERVRARKAAALEAERAPRSKASPEPAAAPASATPASAAASAAEGMINASEVKRRLRSYSEPITLFGESDAERFQRLKQFELVQHEKLTSSHGHKNIFAEILQQDVESEIQAALMKDMEKQRQHDHAAEADDSTAAAGSAGGVSTSAAAASSGVDGADVLLDESGKVVKAPSSKKVDYRGRDMRRSDFDEPEEFVLYFFKRMLSEWESELDARPKEVRVSERGKMASATQKQTRQFIKPLFKLLKSRTTNSDILKACEKMCTACLDRKYNLADEAYLTMAIGNAAWPMGVTMVSIHERAGRTKLFSGQVAHVLNDETQRKYIQSIKRLMTYCQEHYPADLPVPDAK